MSFTGKGRIRVFDMSIKNYLNHIFEEIRREIDNGTKEYATTIPYSSLDPLIRDWEVVDQIIIKVLNRYEESWTDYYKELIDLFGSEDRLKTYIGSRLMQEADIIEHTYPESEEGTDIWEKERQDKWQKQLKPHREKENKNKNNKDVIFTHKVDPMNPSRPQF